tara:strand:- start:65 stop:346 length:282 start_codon:yes stop_codon:yes gene_type:complete
MKSFYISILLLFIISCNTKQANDSKWTEEEKDLTYKECVKYAMDEKQMDIVKSDTYCQCTLNMLISDFENKEDAEIKIKNDNSLRSMFEACEN